MKTFTVAVAMLALIAEPEHAQMGGKRHQGDEKKAKPRRSRQLTRRPTRRRSRGFRSRRKSTTRGASRGPRSPPRNRNKKPGRSITPVTSSS